MNSIHYMYRIFRSYILQNKIQNRKGDDKMKRIFKKFLIMLVTLLAVSFLVFLALSIIPGDAATNMLGTQATQESIEALREEMGLNDPFFVQYFRWLFGCLKGDFGTSYSYHMSVSSLIMDKLPITITLTIFSFIIIFLKCQIINIQFNNCTICSVVNTYLLHK